MYFVGYIIIIFCDKRFEIDDLKGISFIEKRNSNIFFTNKKK